MQGGQNYPSNTPHIAVSGIHLQWDAEHGTCDFDGLPIAMMRVDSSLAGLLSGMQAIVGTERFLLALQIEGRKSVEADWPIFSQFGDFEEGFKAIANRAAVAGWGNWTIAELDPASQYCRFECAHTWEGRYQKALGVCWGSGMLAGKLAGYCTKLFKTNCWADQTQFIARGDQCDAFEVRPSPRVLEGEIEAILATDEASRADMAVMLRRLEAEIAERRQAEQALRESEERLKLALAGAELGAWDWDVVTGHTRYSERWADMLGYDLNELEPHVNQWERLVHPDDRAHVDETVRAHFEGRIDTYTTEHRLRRKSGEWTWVLSKGRVLKRDADGKPLRICGTHLDITDRKLADEALRKSERQLGQAMEMAKLGHWEYDVSKDEFTFNDHFYRVFRTTAEAVGGYTMSPQEYAKRFVHPDHAVLVALEVENAIKATDHNYTSRVEHAVIFGDGTEGYVSVFFFVVKDDQGQTIKTYGVNQDITDRKRADAALRKSEERYRAIFDESVVAIFTFDNEKHFTDSNQAGLDLLGYSREELLALSMPDVDIDPVAVLPAHDTLFAGNRLTNYEHQLRRKDGAIVTVLNNSRPLTSENGAVVGMLSTLLDITDHKNAEADMVRLESQLQQAHKLESIGRLAGGVAHDFNNMLCVILGHAEIALQQVGPNHPLHASLEEMQRAAARSAELTGQLLAFARKQDVSPKVINLNQTVAGALMMLERILGEDIDLDWRPGNNIPHVKVDPSQIDQMLANLCVNAREAIANVGTIVIETGNSTLDEAECKEDPALEPGDYVWLTVRDSGSGMDAETVSHIFEPFFTTKAQGEGSGLGLAMVYGMAKQNHGCVRVQSAAGVGTTFTIYLPRHQGEVRTTPTEFLPRADAGGEETILLVEDEPAILRLTMTMLSKQGYKVLPAQTPQQAIQCASGYPGKIHLIMTDVIMPGMNGRDLAKQLKETRPELACLFMSGYTADVIADHGIMEEDVHFIQKPFSVRTVASKVREALG